MTEPAIETQMKTLRRLGGFAHLDWLGAIEVKGNDARRLLQSRSTNDVFALAPGQGQLNAFLDRTGHLKALFSLYDVDGSYWLVAERTQAKTMQDEIEFYVFREDVRVIDHCPGSSWWTVQGPASAEFLAEAFGSLANVDAQTLFFAGTPVGVFRKPFTGAQGYVMSFPTESSQKAIEDLQSKALAFGLCEISPDALDVARVESGVLRYGIDVSADELITDAGLEQEAVSYTKGCYVGQEIVARIKTYGAPRKGLVGLVFAPGRGEKVKAGSQCMLGGEAVGTVKTCVYSPTLERTIALAYLGRDQRVPGRDLDFVIDSTPYTVRVTLLPFFNPETNKDEARLHYEKGLELFAANEEEEAVKLLREALALDPLFADCYEALGVILNRQSQTDEAIALMKRLSEMDPESIMAHANLSVFYLEKGDKEAAEEEKAIAMTIRMQKLAREAASQAKQAEDERKTRQEALERMGMFRQVLEIDADDLLANYGLGSAYADLGEYENALPFLEKALAIKPSHTVAYLALGACLEGLKRMGEAVRVYKEGVSVAAKRGDMMPLKEMQTRLAALDAGAESRS